MAGIGLLLEKLTRKDDIAGMFQGYPHGFFTALGPWLLMAFWLGGTFLLSTPYLDNEAVRGFRLVLLYNFSFSLVLSGPLLFIINRYLGDLLLKRQIQKSSDMFMGALGVMVVTQVPLVGIFYGWVVGLPGMFRVAASINYFILATLWLLLVYQQATKAYRLTAWTFFFGMMISLGSTVYFAQESNIAGMILGFSAGLMLIVFTLLAYVLSEYRQSQMAPLSFLRYFREYWDLALAGLFYFLALWIDEWVLWFSADAQNLIKNMPSLPGYDTAKAFSWLSIMPAMLVFLIHLETNFHDKYLRYYRAIRHHSKLADVEGMHQIIWNTMKRAARTIGVLQGTISFVMIVGAYQVLRLIQYPVEIALSFRLNLLGHLCHIFCAFLFMFLLLFDFRRVVCYLTGLFVVLSGLGTMLAQSYGAAPGMGYLIASILMAMTTAYVFLKQIKILPYHTFVVSNEST